MGEVVDLLTEGHSSGQGLVAKEGMELSGN